MSKVHESVTKLRFKADQGLADIDAFTSNQIELDGCAGFIAVCKKHCEGDDPNIAAIAYLAYVAVSDSILRIEERERSE